VAVAILSPAILKATLYFRSTFELAKSFFFLPKKKEEKTVQVTVASFIIVSALPVRRLRNYRANFCVRCKISSSCGTCCDKWPREIFHVGEFKNLSYRTIQASDLSFPSWSRQNSLVPFHSRRLPQASKNYA